MTEELEPVRAMLEDLASRWLIFQETEDNDEARRLVRGMEDDLSLVLAVLESHTELIDSEHHAEERMELLRKRTQEIRIESAESREEPEACNF